MTKWLSAEWLDEACRLWAGGPGIDGLSSRVQCEITGGPEGDVSCYWVLEDGLPQSGSVGRTRDADLTLTLGWDDAVEVQRDRLDPNVAFMQGRLKVNGSMAVMSRLLERARMPECRELRRQLAEVSTF